MSARTTPRRLARTLVASAALLAGVLAAAPAHADEATDAPVTADDVANIDAGSYGYFSVLENDSDPNGDELAICRVEVPDDVPLFAEFQGDALAIGSASDKGGTYEITYYACDHDYLTPATITVHVTKVKPVKAAKVSGHPGRVKFTNPGDKKVVILYGSPREENPDGRVGVAAGESKTISTKRTNLFYVAYVARTGSIAGYGTVKGIKQSKKLVAGRVAPVPFTQQELREWRSAL